MRPPAYGLSFIDARGGEAVVQRQGEPTDVIEDPPQASLRVSMQGLRLEPIDGVWNTGPRMRQALAVGFRRLVDAGYRPDMVERFLAWRLQRPRSGPLELQGALQDDAAQPMESFYLQGSLPFDMITWLRSEDGGRVPIVLSDEQVRIIVLGNGAQRAWAELQWQEEQLGFELLPGWYTEAQFAHDMASRVDLLMAFMEAIEVYDRSPSDEHWDAMLNPFAELFESVEGPVNVVEAIRNDPLLMNEPEYRLLWPLSSDAPGAARAAPAGPSVDESDPQMLGYFLTYLRSQPVLSTRAVEGDAAEAPVARRELIERFGTWFTHTALGGRGDQVLSATPTQTASYPPHPASLSAYPALQPPLFDAALGTDHTFTMSIHFPTVFDAFTRYSYVFSLFRVPDAEVVGAASRREAAPPAPSADEPTSAHAMAVELGDLPDRSLDASPDGAVAVDQPFGAVLGARLARDTRYLKADLRTVLEGYETTFGAPGLDVGLAALGGLLRYGGTLISTFFETLFEPSYQEQYVFPAEGLYLVRAAAYAHRPDDAEVTRPPSVAYLPVFARAPELMAEERVISQIDQAERDRERLAELEEALLDPEYGGSERTDLERERDALRVTVRGSLGDVLELQYDDLTAALHELESEIFGTLDPDSDEGRRRLRFHRRRAEYLTLRDQCDALFEILATRGERAGLDGAERLTATFVTDLGQVLSLALEAVDQTPEGEATQRWYVSDSTTQRSGDHVGHGADKTAAILDAVERLLETGAGYGRGTVSILIDRQTHSFPVNADSVELLMEALENVATIASVAAIAAAPFTGGGSLYLLVPIGVVGAIPSAYRLARRLDDRTFRWDLETAMDLVNIVGAAVGASQFAVGARAAQLASAAQRARTVWLSGALMVTGYGADGLGVVLLGVGLMAQIDATSDLPPGLRAARIAEILGNAMLQAGIMIGGTLASRRYHTRLREGIEASETELSRWRDTLNEETRSALADSPSALEAYGRMRPDVRDLLSLCASLCIPLDPPPSQALQERIGALIDRHSPNANDQRYLRAYFHENGATLDAALTTLEGHADLASLRSFLEGALPVADVVFMAFRPDTGPREPATMQLAADMVARGDVDVATLSAIMDHAHARNFRGRRARNLVAHVERLVSTRRPGYADVLNDLARGFNFFTGAEWTIRFISEHSYWDAVTRFEIESAPGGRRWDAEINGTLIQFKSWRAFISVTFVRQFANDWLLTGGFTERTLRWLFDPRIGNRSEIAAMARTAIESAQRNGRAGYTDAEVVAGMLSSLDEIIGTGTDHAPFP